MHTPGMTRREESEPSPVGSALDIAGRVAVVTGGASGIGAACVQLLAAAGAAVAVVDLHDAETMAAGIEYGGDAPVVPFTVDVTDAGAVAEVAERTITELGGLDIWVNSAGIFPRSPVLEMSDEEFDQVIAVNLRGTFLGAREA